MPEFKLTLDPAEKIVFGGKKLGEEATSVQLKITNPLKERVAFKVKCTSNEMFRIRPPVAALKAGESSNITLTFNAGKTVPESGKHYFALYYIVAKEAPRSLWSEHKGEVEGTKKMFVDFNKEGGEAKKEDKKEKKEDKKEEKKEDEKKEEKKDDKKDDKKEEKKEEEEDKEDKKE